MKRREHPGEEVTPTESGAMEQPSNNDPVEEVSNAEVPVQQEQKYRKVEPSELQGGSQMESAPVTTTTTTTPMHNTETPTTPPSQADRSSTNVNTTSSSAQASGSPSQQKAASPPYILPPPNPTSHYPHTTQSSSSSPATSTIQSPPPQLSHLPPSIAQQIPASLVQQLPQRITPTSTSSVVSTAPPPMSQYPMTQIQQMASPIPPQSVGPAPTATASPTSSGAASPRESVGSKSPSRVKFESALDFLDQVKLQFANQPRVYNQFLDIMKDFKAQAIDTPGVIARVSELFKGHKNLILGFNTFLPPGYKIESVNVPDDPIPESQPPPILAQRGQPTSTSTTTTSVQRGAAVAPIVAPPSGVPPSNSGRKQPEFDHARNYVKKIKIRFALQPQIYKAFLEILHTYHKEQHTIKEVYEQVATLFQNHPDLLEEFSQFLPEPVSTPSSSTTSAPPKQQPKKPPARKPKAQEREPPLRELRDKTTRKVVTKRTRERSPPPEESKMGGVPTSGSYEEMNFFYTVKQRLNNQNVYTEFLKCLNLFSQGIISRVELVLLVKDLFGRHRDLFEWFKEIMRFDDQSFGELLERHEERQRSESPINEIDFKTCKRYGPSYRALPKNFIPPVCSGRTELCSSVLNDVWVSVPTGSEDFGFKNLRKNQYEEMLFKCEDDRFELDLVIELNSSTIKALQRIMKTMEKLGTTDPHKIKLDSSLDILHIRSIERIYGDKGSEILDALYTSPEIAIPIILKRLQQKDQEWTKARKEWNKIWREVNEKNYYKSLDHQSFNFKQNDKRNLNSKVLVAEIKQKYQEQLKLRDQLKRKQYLQQLEIPQQPQQQAQPAPSPAVTENTEADKPVEGTTDTTTTTTTAPAPTSLEDIPIWHMKSVMGDKQIFQSVYNFISYFADRNLPKSEKEKIDTFFKHFIRIFFVLGEDSSSNGNAMDIDQSTTTTTTTTTESGSKMGKKQLFFGNPSFYVFFRLFEIFYERLEKAKEMSKNPQTNSQFAFLLNPNRDRKLLEDEKDKYQAYQKLLQQFINGNKDQSTYEDDCRSLFGLPSYILFTMDKVLNQLVKQLQSLLSEETCSKILALYSYECSSTSGEPVYHSNCFEIVRDERVFKFEYDTTTKDFTIQLLDSQINPPKFVELPDKQHRWSQYVEQFTGSDDNTHIISESDIKKRHVFLMRNKKRVIKNYNQDESKLMENIDMIDGLEFRISLTNYRLFYIEHTEDYFYRRGKLSSSKEISSKFQSQQRKQRLSKLLSTKFSNVYQSDQS